jgi:hypothetical protein
MFSATLKAFAPLVVGVAGVLVAWLSVSDLDDLWRYVVGGVLVVAFIVGLVVGRRINYSNPVTAWRRYELQILTPMSLAIAASAALIGVAVVFEPSEDAALVISKLLAAGAGVVTAFLTAAFIKEIGSIDDTVVGEEMASGFKEAYPASWVWEGEEAQKLKARLHSLYSESPFTKFADRRKFAKDLKQKMDEGRVKPQAS